MQNLRCSTYRGHSITTRWLEIAPLVPSGPRRFEASFSVECDGRNAGSWQEFAISTYNTSLDASVESLTAARRSIDERMIDVPPR